jgi:hypothetical protein
VPTAAASAWTTGLDAAPPLPPVVLLLVLVVVLWSGAS